MNGERYLNLLDNFVLSVVSRRENFTTTLLAKWRNKFCVSSSCSVDWAWRINKWLLPIATLTPCDNFVCAWAKEETYGSKSRTLDELEQQMEIISPLFLLSA